MLSDGLRDYPMVSIQEAIQELANNTSIHYSDRLLWLRSWPSQVILTVSMIVWTQQVEQELGAHSMLVKLFQQS